MRILFATLAILLLSACGTYKATTQVDDTAYIQFTGDTSNVVFTLDGRPSHYASDASSFDLNGLRATRYEIQPGTHKLRVQKGGKLLFFKKFYVSSGNVYEVKLP